MSGLERGPASEILREGRHKALPLRITGEEAKDDKPGSQILRSRSG